MMQPRVSILIPAYNAGRWIEDTIRSALAQSWSNIEIVVVDDGSRDDTLARAQDYRSSRLRVVTQRNRGAAAARNTAFALSTGDYIQWLDADDLLAPDKIERQMEVALKDASDRTLCSGSFGEFLTNPRLASYKPSVLWQDLAPADFLAHRFNANAWMNPASWLVSRSLTLRAGPWDERLSLDDDGEYFARVVSQSRSIRFVPESRMYYRRANAHSLSRATSDRACESLLLSLRLCIGHLLDLEDSPRTRQASLRMLQNWIDLSDCFCPDAPERFEAMRSMARDLGGDLVPHRLSWKYVPVRALFGWKTMRRARAGWSRLKLSMQVLTERRLARGLPERTA